MSDDDEGGDDPGDEYWEPGFEDSEWVQDGEEETQDRDDWSPGDRNAYHSDDVDGEC